MRIATWNVNSVRARVDRITDWLERSGTDVLAMQETKCKDEQFPYAAFEAAGYQVAHAGLSQWNGVALVSRVGLQDVQIGFADQPAFGKPEQTPVVEARAIAATCNGVRVWSLYVPNGRTLDDPHYTYKLQWLAKLYEDAQRWLTENPSAQIALTGDWNIAPTDEDVWDMSVFDGATHVSSAERQAFKKFTDNSFTDVVRPHTEGPGVYTYWDYTQLRFPKKQGMRIDFILGSPEFANRVSAAHIDREERKGKGASDHAPVVVDLT
ncbi:MAG: exodeoxyribonuclease III [Mycobacteriaceae bacterium]